jgi:membrane-bound metal-dependent hydrolase YbcI (DUF457 family)
MDIVTHAGIGLVAAAPFMATRPEVALGLIAGSVLPDLDALSRVFGKRAFLRSHQTWTHALPIQAAGSAAVGLAAHASGAEGWLLGWGLFAGLAIHTLLDFSNTLGVTLFAPFTRKRFCLEWVFFIDAFVLAATAAAVAGMLGSFFREGEGPAGLAIAYIGVIAVYFCAKGWLRRRAGQLAPEAVSLVPSALWPWQFLGATEDGACVRLFRLNAISGTRAMLAVHDILDATHAQRLARVPEFGLMQRLSPVYHVISARQTGEGEVVVCRDLRIRNFGTTFGDLEVWLDANQSVIRTRFHV